MIYEVTQQCKQIKKVDGQIESTLHVFIRNASGVARNLWSDIEELPSQQNITGCLLLELLKAD